MNKKLNITAYLIAALIMGIVFGEYVGWPFLAAPLEKRLTSLANRQVNFSNYKLAKIPESNIGKNQSTAIKAFHISFLGGITLKTAYLYISSPSWSAKPHFMSGKNILLKMRYIDLWHAYRGQQIRIDVLQASYLDANLERKADGQASWQFRDKVAEPEKAIRLPTFDKLLLTTGLFHIVDVPLKSDIEAKLSLVSSIANVNNVAKNDLNVAKNSTLTVSATGRFKALPLKIELVSTGKFSQYLGDTNKHPASVILNAAIGRAKLKFKGATKDMLHPSNFAGDYDMSGPSLAAVGDLVGVTLPTTAKFNTSGSIDKQNLFWRTNIKQMAIGGSRLNGRFSYDKSFTTPLLKGQLAGKLVITDLGPAFGAVADNKNPNKVLPSRPFDLASLRKMNANVIIDMQYLDLKTRLLEPLKPLQAHLKLNNAVLTLKNIKALTADGRLTGDMGLDGRGSKALWDANLAWNGVRLERWVKQQRANGLPPYISGRLNGKALLKGQGKSTAEILANLDGSIRSELYQGAISHLAIELAGLDVAESLGILFKGDAALPVQCGVIDLQAKNGVFTPRLLVIDTVDTTVWVDGSLSLASEMLNLRAMALPKDFSPLTLRVPLNVTGNFANPQVSLDKKPVGLKLAASVLLAIVNSFAAVIPLLDSGDNKEAKQRAAGCQNLLQKNKPR